jgi:hypothetical protein
MVGAGVMSSFLKGMIHFLLAKGSIGHLSSCDRDSSFIVFRRRLTILKPVLQVGIETLTSFVAPHEQAYSQDRNTPVRWMSCTYLADFST